MMPCCKAHNSLFRLLIRRAVDFELRDIKCRTLLFPPGGLTHLLRILDCCGVQVPCFHNGYRTPSPPIAIGNLGSVVVENELWSLSRFKSDPVISPHNSHVLQEGQGLRDDKICLSSLDWGLGDRFVHAGKVLSR